MKYSWSQATAVIYGEEDVENVLEFLEVLGLIKTALVIGKTVNL